MKDLYFKFQKLLKVLLSSDKLWYRALINGVAPSTEHLEVLKNYNFCTVVDIGANRGQFALAARHCYKAANIFSFEPLELPANTYRKIFSFDNAVIMYDYAVSEDEGKVDIHVSARDDSSSILPISDLQEKYFPGTNEVGVRTINISRLSKFLSADKIHSPSLLKIDVQGNELNTLKGCEDLLNHFDRIYCECSFVELYQGQSLVDEIINWLHGRGFVMEGVYNSQYDKNGLAIQSDFMFKKLD